MTCSRMLTWSVACLALLAPACGGGTSNTQEICSLEHPAGKCPAGQTCVDGQCRTDEAACDIDHPNGTCEQGQVCFEGACLAESELCSSIKPSGRCPQTSTCLDGVCRDDGLLCSTDNTTGLCEAGRVCLDGDCLATADLCSGQNPDGRCSQGNTCLDGVCTDDDLICGPDNPAGLCPGQLTCVAGHCTDTEHACGPLYPDGSCPSGKTCLDGTCTSDNLLCGPDNQTGLCPAGQSCEQGVCQQTSCDQCAEVGKLRCLNEQVQTCELGQNGCLSWSDPLDCGAGKTCLGEGECLDIPDLVISEILYRAPGADNDTFVEIYGPAGTELAGLVLVGVNGSSGNDYQPIELSGTISSDGFFVVAHSLADSAILNEADQLSDNVDYQNGPDSIQLRFGAAIVDAVGYGDFAAGDTFAGEGTPAPGVLDAQSLARDENESDTDDNGVDFHALLQPTPGAINVQQGPQAPVAVLACPLTGQVDQDLEFDASGSSDDVAIVDYRFEFGDGDSVSGVNNLVEHAYTGANSYTVTLTVSDGDGLTDSDSCLVTVSGGSQNTPPVADFVVVKLGGLEVQVDATSSHDLETQDLEMRWDFDDDGIWETGWSTVKTSGYSYTTDNSYSIRLEVRDQGGLTDQSVRTVTVSSGENPIYAPGIIQSDTTWSGIVIMANDVTVNQDATLTITAGTMVLVAGDYTLESNGPLMVNGSAIEPVIFTTYYAADNQPGSYQGVICYDPTTRIYHMLIEYGTTCLTLWNNGIVAEDVEARSCVTGIQVWGDTDLTRVIAHDNQQDGLAVGGYNVNVRNSHCYANGESGLHFNDWSSNTVHNVFQSQFEDNGLHGVFKEGPGTLNLTESDFVGNGQEGVRLSCSNQGCSETVARSCNFNNNAGAGAYLSGNTSSWPHLALDAANCDMLGNENGLVIQDAVITLDMSLISTNHRYGMKIDSQLTGSVCNQNNIYGNSTVMGMAEVDPMVTLVTDDQFTGTQTTSWAVPGGELARYFHYQIIGGGDSYNFRFGSTPGGSDLTNGWVSGGDYSSDVFIPEQKSVDTIYIGLDDTSATSGISLTMDDVGYESSGVITELYCVYDGAIDAPIDLSGNYWGTPDPETVSFLRGSGDADLSGPLSSPVAGAGNH